MKYEESDILTEVIKENNYYENKRVIIFLDGLQEIIKRIPPLLYERTGKRGCVYILRQAEMLFYKWQNLKKDDVT